MRRSLVARLVVWTMVVTFSTAGFAADLNSAMLKINGKVLVNGSELKQGQAVFAGDTIASAVNSSATLSLAGSSVQMSPSSSVSLQKNGVTLKQGSARVSTGKRLATKVDNLTITPAADQADYTVRRNGTELQIAAGSAAITLNDGVRTLTIEPGKAISVKAPRAAAPQGGGEGLTGMQWLLIAAVAIVSTVVVVATTQEDESAETPFVP